MISNDFPVLGHRKSRPSATVILLLTLLSLGATTVRAQSNPCAQQSSFQFPLWSDAIGWNQIGLYNTIQLADIDADGQDELLGYGPYGVEVWHWEPNGQSWIPMHAGPPFGSTDNLMTADVDGDGQAEIIQITPQGGTASADDTVINIWHYSTVEQTWTRLPQLRQELPASVALKADVYQGAFTYALLPSPPLIQFVDLNKSGQKQLVYVQTVSTGAPGSNGSGVDVYATPIAYQVKADGSGWTTIGSGSPTHLPLPYGGFPLYIGDFNGDGLPDLLFQEVTGFMIFRQLPSSTPGQVSFASGEFVNPGIAAATASFTLGDVAGTGKTNIIVVPTVGVAVAYTYNGTAYLQYSNSSLNPYLSSAPLYPSQYGSIQTAVFGRNSALPKQASVLDLAPDGLYEYTYSASSGWSIASKTPFLTSNRFGGDPSYYKTIQTGVVQGPPILGNPGSLQPIVIARDANALHTLTYTSNACQTGAPGFQVPQTPYFPAFFNGRLNAYSYINQFLNVTDLRQQYSNSYEQLSNYLNAVSTLPFPTTVPASNPFTLADFAAVQSQLVAELTAAGNSIQFFTESKNDAVSLFQTEYNQIPVIVGDLNLPSDQVNNQSAGFIVGNVLTQVVGSLFSGFGLSDDAADHIGLESAGANAVALAISIIGDVISDVQSAETSSPSSLPGATLSIEKHVLQQITDAQTSNGNAQAVTLQNWDLMKTLSDAINSGRLKLSTQLEATAITNASNQYQIATWQTLAPQVWEVGAQEEQSLGQVTFPSFPYIVETPLKPDSYRGGVQRYVVLYPAIAGSSCQGGFSYQSPVAESALNDLLALGVNLNDIVGQRNGWEQMPFCDSPFPALQTDYFPVPPAPGSTTTTVVAGAPAQLMIMGGGNTPSSTFYNCANSQSIVLEQSTPINSIFPDMLGFQVVDAAKNAVPNATISLSSSGLYPSAQLLTTNSSGFAGTTLVAGARPGTYTVTATVVSPTPNPAYPACALSKNYIVQDTPSAISASEPPFPGYIDIQSKSGTAASRTWSLATKEILPIASTMSLTGLTLLQKSGAPCAPAVKTALPATMTGPDSTGNFQVNVTIDFSSCSATAMPPQFNVTANATASVLLTDGVSYPVGMITSTFVAQP